jgi:two-component system OmpR family response regulator
MAQRSQIALLGENRDILRPFAEYLSEVGYDTHVGRSLAQIAAGGHAHALDLIVLHLIEGREGGLDLLRQLRDSSSAAIVVISRGADLVDRIAGLETGADDVVVLPVEEQELAARIRGIIGRRGGGPRETMRLENTTIDFAASRLLRVGAKPERLGPGEVALIRALTRHPRRVLSRDELMDLAPAESLDVNDRSIDTRVARLRRKLDTEAIVTVRGHGYMFVPPFERAD